MGSKYSVSADLVEYDFNITWVLHNPDGLQLRPIIGINDYWPPPIIRATVGDRLVVHVHNQLGNQSTSLHFHGLFLENATHMDGAVQVSQCAIPPGSSMTYNFTINQSGTYWYHSHISGQYPDGLRAPLLVHDPNPPFAYNEELVISLSDWYHDQMPDLLAKFITKSNPTGAEPVPQSVLLNDTTSIDIPVENSRFKDHVYLVHVVNMGAFSGQYLWFEGHNMTVVEIDGVYTQPQTTPMIYLTAGQRYSFLLTGRNDSAIDVSNFPFVASMDTTMFDTVPPGFQYNATGWLVYNVHRPLPQPALLASDAFDANNPLLLDDATGLVPQDAMPLLGEPDVVVELNVSMQTRHDGANYAFFNNITYRHPIVPTLYTVLSANASNNDSSNNIDGGPEDARIYGTYTQTTVIPRRSQVVQLVINNLDAGRHPFHLHGHNFQVVYRSAANAGTFDPVANASLLPAATSTPIRRDSLLIYPNGFAVLRFRADNPGVWLFHCHIEWHLSTGLVATFVEAPVELQQQYALSSGTSTVPDDHFAACAVASVPTAGNAAGNRIDFLDLKGENVPPAALPEGFTAGGIVAFVFSCISGIAGVAVVSWYGLAGGIDEDKDEQPDAGGVRNVDAQPALPP
ncbi:hypothetical protein SBRCBS47491_004968 [Sporothrix bragantina]|uniref:Ferrooxidoreductase Fet3 n=1 Tax=Sporothrix bragantina TaxID=671064 RepID=A0ABP0BSU1_9PEZI